MDGTSEIPPKGADSTDGLAEENARLRRRILELEPSQREAGRVSGDLANLDYTQITTANLASVIDLMPVAAAVFDDEKKLVAWNAAYKKDADLLGTKGVPLVLSVLSFGLAAATQSITLSRWQKASPALLAVNRGPDTETASAPGE